MIIGVLKIWLRNSFYISRPSFYAKTLTLICVAILLGLVLGLLIDERIMKFATNDPGSNISLIFKLLIIITFLRIIIPKYQPLSSLVKKYYPVSVFKMFIINLLLEFFTEFFFFVFLLLIVITFSSEYFNFVLLIQSVLIVATTHLLRRTVQQFIEHKYNTITYVYNSLLISLITIISFITPPYEPQNFVSITIILGLLMVISIRFELPTQQMGINPSFSMLRLKGISSQLLIFNSSVRISLLVGFIAKTALLLLDFILLDKTGRHLLDGNLLYWVFIASPIFCFSYVFNNLWGFYRSLWLQLRLIASKDWGKYLLIFAKIAYVPVLIDAFISISLLLFLWDNKLFVLTYYFISLLFLFCFSFYWSFERPVYLTSSTIFSISSSPSGNLYCMVGAGLLYLINLTPLFYLLVPIYIGISYLLLEKAKTAITNDTLNVFSKLFS